MYAPFVEDSDDTLQQLAQFQIFLTLVSALALRVPNPSPAVGTILGIILVAVPLMGVYLETDLPGAAAEAWAFLSDKAKQIYGKLRPPDQTYLTEKGMGSAAVELASPRFEQSASAPAAIEKPDRRDPSLNA